CWVYKTLEIGELVCKDSGGLIMALDDVERNAERKGVVENDPLAGQVQDEDLAQLGKERRITSETDTIALQSKSSVPELELAGTAGSTLHVLNDKSAYITLQPGLRHLGFPDTGDPFQKEWVDKNEGKWEGLWRGIKGLFGGHETLEDKAKEREIANLTPEQRKQYEKEEKELSAWKTREGTMMSIAYQGSPPPDCPMHREVERRVAQFEQDVKDEVLREMT